MNVIFWNDLFSWLQASLASQCLQLLKVNLHSVYLKDFLNMLGLFLSASFSQKQILSLNLFIKSNKKEISSSEMPSVDFLKKQLEKVDDRVLQNKSIEFVAKGYSFFLSKLNPIRLGGLIATRISSARISTLLQQFIASEVRLNSVDLSSFKTTDHYKNLLKGALLKSIIFTCSFNKKNCHNSPCSYCILLNQIHLLGPIKLSVNSSLV